MKKLLIISNNVLSYTNNNGKTILSFINGAENLQIKQLYFSGEYPRVDGFDYFQISDKDIIKGFANQHKRGRNLNSIKENDLKDDFSIRKKIGRNDITLLLRDCLWFKNWKSNNLVRWLDDFSPDSILFVAGDAIFPYSICKYIVNRYKSKLTVYVTDDYIMPRKHENIIHRFRRFLIKKSLVDILSIAKNFYTISSLMSNKYREELGYDSYLAINMSDDLKDSSLKCENKDFIFTYAGSLYYGRDLILAQIAQAIKRYNDSSDGIKCRLEIYSNQILEGDALAMLSIENACAYKGSLNRDELKIQFNKSDALVFVESFNEEQIEKVKYSLSTKVPEYLSLEKPILAVGPRDIASMEYLKDVSFCAYSENEISLALNTMMEDLEKRLVMAFCSRNKFLKKHNRETLQNVFLKTIV